MRGWLWRVGPWVLWLGVLVPRVTLARAGGGQHYSTGSHGSSSGDDSGDGDAGLVLALIELTFRYPQFMCPVLVLVGLGYFYYQRTNNPTARTQRALEEREPEVRATASQLDIAGWVNTLKLKDPAFEPLPLLAKVQTLFVDTQQAWFRRDMSPVRRFLSDAVVQRFTTQLKLLTDQGVRNAIADVHVNDVQWVGLDTSDWYDTVHLRVSAQMRDADVAANLSDQQALAAAAKAPLAPFVEIWSFVRKPGAQSKPGADLAQGKCPNCGAPFKGGATNNCEFCGAIVNSGNYDWTLAEITQEAEQASPHQRVDGLLELRQADPAFNLEILQDRASLIFWKWVDAESHGESRRLAKLATPELLARLGAELDQLKSSGRRKVFLECAVGGVRVRLLRAPPTGFQEAHMEIRWSARTGVGPVNEKPTGLPTLPQRWVFSLRRKAGATTNTANGMSTSRCPQCNAPLTESLSPTCDFCGFQLDTGERDWVLSAANPFERWNATEQQRFDAASAGAKVAPPADGEVLDAHERERLLYMMAAIAAADGVVTDDERKMLQLFSKRWSVPWEKVEMALGAGPQLFERLIPPRGSPEAGMFLKSLVTIALVDGKVDRKERQMLDAAAQKLGMVDALRQMLGGR